MIPYWWQMWHSPFALWSLLKEPSMYVLDELLQVKGLVSCFETVWGSSTCLQLKSVPPPRANWVLWDKKHSDVGNPLFSRETSDCEQALNGILGCHGSVREVRAVSGKRFLKEKPPDVLILNKSFLLAVVLQFRISWNERELPNELCWRSCSHDKPSWHLSKWTELGMQIDCIISFWPSIENRFHFYPIPVEFVVFYFSVFRRFGGGPKATHPFCAATDFRGCILASIALLLWCVWLKWPSVTLHCMFVSKGKGHPTWKGSISTEGPPFGIECCGFESGKVRMQKLCRLYISFTSIFEHICFQGLG